MKFDSPAIRPSGYGLWWRDLAINGRASVVNQITATIDFAF